MPRTIGQQVLFTLVLFVSVISDCVQLERFANANAVVGRYQHR